MKKSLLLSIAASAMIFAGGDIAPVEPAAPASADFWGQIGFAYQAQDEDWKGLDFGDESNNAFSATVVLGVEKELGYGFGFGAELAGWSAFGLDIADGARVESPSQSAAEVSQAYLTYTFGNTAIKAGRQALPKAVSPWAWSDRSAGVIDWSYDGIVVANTDLADTTLIGAWISQIYHNGDEQYHVSDSAGLFMLGMVNKSISNTTLFLSGYYVTDSLYDINNPLPGNGSTAKDTWSFWADAVTELNGVTLGVQGAYVDGDYANTDATYAIAGKVGSKWGKFDAELIASYINDGDYSLMLGGTGLEDSALWTDNEENADRYTGMGSGNSQGQSAVLLKAGYALPVGKLYGSVGYWDFDNAGNGDIDNTFGARVGYKLNIMGVDSKVEYRYRDRSLKNSPDQTRQRIRVEAYYKF
jgi:hypothetical protein